MTIKLAATAIAEVTLYPNTTFFGSRTVLGGSRQDEGGQASCAGYQQNHREQCRKTCLHNSLLSRKSCRQDNIYCINLSIGRAIEIRDYLGYHYFMTILIVLFVIIGLSVLILAHEGGHFVCSKLFGLKVDEFGIGFPPRIFAKKKGDTEYSVNWLPFGGFVKIAGERGEFSLEEELADGANRDVRDAESKHVDAKRLFYAQPAWKKSIILLAGVFMNFIIGWFLISLALTVSAPKALIVSDIEPNSPAAMAGLAQGDIIKKFFEFG